MLKSYGNYFLIALGTLFLLVTALFFVFTSKPQAYGKMLARADAYAKSGQIAFALEEYKKIIGLYPGKYNVHLKMGELYEQLDEINRAKVSYVMAIRLDQKHRHKAHINLAKIYCKEKKYTLAEEIIEEIEHVRDRKTQEQIGNIYFKWGEHLSQTAKPDSIRKFKKARQHYKKAGSKLDKNALENIIEIYARIADELVLAGKSDEAVKILKLSANYEDNALAHYKLAQVYEKMSRDDRALEEYKQAFKMAPEVADTGSYVSLLMKKGAESRDKGDKTTAEYYFSRAKKLDSRADVPLNPDKRLLFSLIATRVNEDIENDLLIPGIIFKLINISGDELDNIRVKVVFLRENRPLDTQIITVADKKKPLKGDAHSPEIQVFSNNTVKHVFDDHDLRVRVYVSQFIPDKWSLFRAIEIVRERKPVSIRE